jgi:hypothetical protein
MVRLFLRLNILSPRYNRLFLDGVVLRYYRFVRDKIPVGKETTNMLAITVFMYS